MVKRQTIKRGLAARYPRNRNKTLSKKTNQETKDLIFCGKSPTKKQKDCPKFNPSVGSGAVQTFSSMTKIAARNLLQHGCAAAKYHDGLSNTTSLHFFKNELIHL